MARKYWIRFRLHIPGASGIAEGDSECTRELPITEMRDLVDVGQSILNGLLGAQKIPPGTRLEIIHWQAFEQPSIALPLQANTLYS